MKTTVELSDELLVLGRKVAKREGLTLKALLEEGLRLALKARQKKPAAKTGITPFEGDGLASEFSDASWERIREEIYRDRV
jgi:hypothetical protein